MILSLLTGTIGRYLFVAVAILGVLIWLRSGIVAPYKAQIVQEKAACNVKLANLRTDAERTISDILSTVGDSGDTSENVAQYCKRNPGLCRKDGE